MHDAQICFCFISCPACRLGPRCRRGRGKTIGRSRGRITFRSGVQLCLVYLQCFLPAARSIWQRKVAVELDAVGVRSVEIDGVAVYTFNINGTVIMTAVDGERIQIDIEALTWSSDLRGLASGRGGCTR